MEDGDAALLASAERPIVLARKQPDEQAEEHAREEAEHHPDDGVLVIQRDGDDVTEKPPHRRAIVGLGRSFQEARLYPTLTVRESIAVTEEDVRQEIEQYAAQTGREPAAVRAALEKEGGLGRIYAGLRRERTVKWLLEKANITS